MWAQPSSDLPCSDELLVVGLECSYNLFIKLNATNSGLPLSQCDGYSGGGLVFRPGSSAGGFLDYLLQDDIIIGYVYEVPTSMSGSAYSGIHEVFLGYNFSFTKQKTLSPRRV